MPKVAPPADEDAEPGTEETTGPIAMLRTGDETAEESPAEPTPDVSADDDEQPSDSEAAAPEPVSSSASTDASASADADEEPAVPIPGDDPIDSELAELIEEASTAESSAPDPTPAVVTTLPGPEEEEEEKPRKPRRRPAVRRRRVREEQPVSALPLTDVEDPKQLTRYRIRWALTLIVLVVMFFILLWASRELLSALSEVKQAVTPGGIGGG